MTEQQIMEIIRCSRWIAGCCIFGAGLLAIWFLYWLANK